MNKFEAVNWNAPEADYTELLWTQNTSQFWLDTEIPISKDLKSWVKLSQNEKLTFMRVLGGLTLLDTEQGNVGMPMIAQHVADKQKKAILIFQAAMEEIHAKSYSTIFTTVASSEMINDTFEWVKEDKHLQYKTSRIDSYYKNIQDGGNLSLYQAMVASVFLESFLFYSGFFYPLYLAGQGKMVASGEIIKLIVRDESVHGVFVGLLAQEVFQQLSGEEQAAAARFVQDLLNDLYKNELEYTEKLYDPIGLTHEVKKYIRYNANKALMNLGLEPVFEEEEVNPVVLNGIRTQTTTHDFFSTKGQGYQKGKVEPLHDEDFDLLNRRVLESNKLGI
ncbi:class 1b ribonucleoside-diphosphate reductase subunit beta [Paenibacillus apiarius]|uniref:Ribonucleoside-diphosphate reductase subunit beta n=1 Tax=Paenibacillus apiarius TaxID=46240 RepID=A0ABT4DR03_9BACL|nr:class 1b ribonucleoside-diphosphate reductase subunit beta [Paenibacillus apiarius]MBN3526853.1 class 1b ribonucleoside-diphosphate reductase subunit beta [Paenibacillus apiarius]MCY9513363.1 class 1b ribonucleoside-diphosphate reductase subunit beta [Paenibacillus apiarius]MCY9519665.1 class 1b ribonucleoside-diphosphate reductase subunit beta [Paenibacillus apiarius]MCY9553279.1 class 1b ribonucleoside-diphosphate reductase subunit beta [Paenibacillus apiarius]MCY9557129.1 class 1b ribonu